MKIQFSSLLDPFISKREFLLKIIMKLIQAFEKLPFYTNNSLEKSHKEFLIVSLISALLLAFWSLRVAFLD